MPFFGICASREPATGSYLYSMKVEYFLPDEVIEIANALSGYKLQKRNDKLTVYGNSPQEMEDQIRKIVHCGQEYSLRRGGNGNIYYRGEVRLNFFICPSGLKKLKTRNRLSTWMDCLEDRFENRRGKSILHIHYLNAIGCEKRIFNYLLKGKKIDEIQFHLNKYIYQDYWRKWSEELRDRLSDLEYVEFN